MQKKGLGVYTLKQELFLEMNDISKKYGDNQVLKGINLTIKQGEIHALLGENGAGKSTLMNVLFGMPVIHSTGGYGGMIKINGVPTEIKSPQHAMKLGIGMVHQEFMLIPGFTVAENIKLNCEPCQDNWYSNILAKVFGKRMALLDIDQMGRDARAALDIVDVSISENLLVEGLSVGYMQFIEIAREIDKKQVKLIVFDEPTAVLTESEANRLLKVMKQLAEAGIAIIFITHRLDEAMEVCDNITILRDGEVIATKKTEETNAIELAELMVGRKIEKISTKTKKATKEDVSIILELKDFGVDMPGEYTDGVDLKVYQGEIFGIGGLGGQGKLSIPNGIMGLYPTRGNVVLNGENIENISTGTMLDKGCAFVSEDRRGTGLLLDSSIETNIMVTSMQSQHGFLKRVGFFTQADKAKIRKHSLEMIKKLDIRCTGPAQHMRRLSGGNQQKVCVARALTLNPQLLLVSEPTRGIDIGAKRLLLEYLVRLNQEQGVTIIITSSELAELRSVCDRIAIISGGKVEGILSPNDSDTNYGLAMSGLYRERGEEVNL